MDWWNLWVPFVGTILGIIVNVCINRSQTKKNHELQKEITQKQIDADVILKSRMHWIDNTKNIASEFLIDSLKLVTLNANLVEHYYKITALRELQHNNSLKLKEKDLDTDEKEKATKIKKTVEKEILAYKEIVSQSNIQVNELIYRTSKNNTLLLLNFSNNIKNNEIIDLVKFINSNLRIITNKTKELEVLVGDENVNWNMKIEESTARKKIINKKVDELTLKLRDYYKKEWEKVKEGM
ncbi:hypothetical protein LT173_002776 [Enterococcus faecalis]|uniref:hypothetical protein n=4 Tax=Enterococcus faecalis TaxID=1351 RepID=UPI000354124D|nr:hypothetical protein [Enterococcus faecalis]EGO5983971.1 hypothetical protein [Enterococcus faecalis]EGO6093617.1 hypothetical protein [Enterococcus faecalis]EGO8055125.1 hypothetical protein [Enterococcus faecalis]EHY9613908.1 hypothetical protein [Enterococcus faecalis]EHZ5087818.1 hypothetical protein [Enterococcus faecalis]